MKLKNMKLKKQYLSIAKRVCALSLHPTPVLSPELVQLRLNKEIGHLDCHHIESPTNT